MPQTRAIEQDGKKRIPVSEAPVQVHIKPPKFDQAAFKITGVTPLVLNAFSRKAREQMKIAQQTVRAARRNKNPEPKNFEQAYEGARHRSVDGWDGIPASAFRNAVISACRVAGYAMTKAKLSVFVVADGYDVVDGTPLVKITKGKPRYVEHMVRLESGTADIRPRPMWEVGWETIVTVRWDADQFSAQDVVNLMARAGLQVGVGEGRPDSKNSAGLGWGLFEVTPA